MLRSLIRQRLRQRPVSYTHLDVYKRQTFLISQQNNIVRIRRCIKNICETYGTAKTASNGVCYYAFPTAQALAGLEEDALMACNLGYRSKYVVRAAKAVSSGEVDLAWISSLNYQKARAELLKLFGVGEKVADCICLFALHHLDAFPVDTHIRQVMAVSYTHLNSERMLTESALLGIWLLQLIYMVPVNCRGSASVSRMY